MASDSAVLYIRDVDEHVSYPHRALLESEGPDKLLITPIRAGSVVNGLLEIHGDRESTQTDLERLADLLQPFGAGLIRARSELVDARRELEPLVRASDEVQMAQLAFMLVHDLAGLYHNLQEPLELLLSVSRHGQSLERQARHEMVNAVADALAPLHDQFAQLARLGRLGRDDSDKTNRLQLAHAVRSAIDLYTQQSKRYRVRLTHTMAADPILKGVSRSQVDRVIYNLLSNAIYWASQSIGGEVVVEVDTNSTGPVLRVMDNGPGLDPTDIARIFEPGFSTKRNGTGLGLASVSRSVAAMGASIAVRTSLGRGFLAEVQWAG